ncbi:MAG TPA: DUF4352 domain-containing protein [Bryobacteraceae bacterium]|nr:DUF4352 domain-containing protein [Bryobacteraceae bacterium]
MPRLRPLVLSLTAAVALSLNSCGSKPAAVRTYDLGQRVELGHLIYTVFETQWLPVIGTGLGARVPQNRFFLVRMTIVNAGSEELLAPNLSIEDDQHNSYDELSNGDGVPQYLGYLRRLKPAESLAGNIVFDAPPKHFKLKVTDENGDQSAYVDIPLNFTAETPEVPIPNSNKPDSGPPQILSPGKK